MCQPYAVRTALSVPEHGCALCQKRLHAFLLSLEAAPARYDATPSFAQPSMLSRARGDDDPD